MCGSVAAELYSMDCPKIYWLQCSIVISPALVVMSHKSNTCTVCMSQANHYAGGVCMGPCPCDQPNTEDADMEQALPLHDITTKVL